MWSKILIKNMWLEFENNSPCVTSLHINQFLKCKSSPVMSVFKPIYAIPTLLPCWQIFLCTHLRCFSTMVNTLVLNKNTDRTSTMIGMVDSPQNSQLTWIMLTSSLYKKESQNPNVSDIHLLPTLIKPNTTCLTNSNFYNNSHFLTMITIMMIPLFLITKMMPTTIIPTWIIVLALLITIPINIFLIIPPLLLLTMTFPIITLRAMTMTPTMMMMLPLFPTTNKIMIMMKKMKQHDNITVSKILDTFSMYTWFLNTTKIVLLKTSLMISLILYKHKLGQHIENMVPLQVLLKAKFNMRIPSQVSLLLFAWQTMKPSTILM